MLKFEAVEKETAFLDAAGETAAPARSASRGNVEPHACREEVEVQHETAQTEGLVIHRARWYDLFDGIVPFMRAIREKLVEIAAPAPSPS